MIALLQRTRDANVTVNNQTIARIERGILALVGIEKHDDWVVAEKLSEKILNYRIFPDSEDRMNLSLRDTQYELLLVSQFTLAANTHKGNRPGFDNAMPPQAAQEFFQRFCEYMAALHPHKVQTGSFGANMQVSLCNDGPVTFWLQY